MIHHDQLSPFENWIVPADGGAPYHVDFSEFYFGRQKKDVPPRARRFWTADIVGMPNLAEDFRHVMVTMAITENRFSSYAAEWRNVHRFLQSNPDLLSVNSISDFRDAHGVRLKQWLHEQKGASHYSRIKWIVDQHFALRHQRRSPWPASDPDKEPDPPEPDLVGLQRLNLELRNHARDIKAMWRSGASLAALGIDPRYATDSETAWQVPENHIRLIYNLTCEALPTHEQISLEGIAKLSGARSQIARPPYVALGQGVAKFQGYGTKLRWRFPGFGDLATFLWIVLSMSGWNRAAALNIDITDDRKWFYRALQDEDHVLMFTNKERSGKRVYSPSKVRAEFHPFSIVKCLIEVTLPLRRAAQSKLEELLNQNKSSYSHSKQREISRLQQVVKSPWLYVSPRNPFEVFCLHPDDSTRLNKFVQNVAAKANLIDDHPYLATLTTSQARDSMINFAYRHSQRLSVAKLAAQHSNFLSLRHYLARRKMRRANFQTVNAVLTHTFSSIRRYGIFDEAKIKIALRTGEITPEQEARLRDFRARTRLGMGCLDPLHPPHEIDPYHRENSVCRVQRCTGCIHGRVFPESVQPLAATLADLHHLRRDYPLGSWNGSSFDEEEESIRLTLQLFDPAVVARHYRAREKELHLGKEVFDVYPHY
ncbi:hypothetical protein [Agrobacterium fabrum]|uniref:hypothetical protein n=1 Tax=Agrobacterium fabrum TaxID=1176649 RepID=UPI0015736EC1|nr:hypothetical protein [Agrobacterium fabrum]WCK77706.1 hypothetical protein G6L39_007100 [Agrobacterium fabrum]